jgi:hypothetical protein
MSDTYLKKYYLDDHKLAQRARLEFFRSLSSGRMIAFVGSMATQAFGYGSWAQLRMLFAALATSSIDKLEGSAGPCATDGDRALWARMRETIASFDEHSAANRWPATVGMSLIDEALELWRGPIPDDGSKSLWPLDEVVTLRQAVRVDLATRFRKVNDFWALNRASLDAGFRKSGSDFDNYFNVPRALWDLLGIRRFVTPNYDFELERVAMLDDLREECNVTSAFDVLRKLRSSPGENFSWDLGSGRIRRAFADGWAIESDVLNRERIDRMIEFAVGTDDVDGHILHLHGRACNWRTMIVSSGDYDNQYRLNDLNRAPFEFAKRLMFGGNPMLFVGLGMSEAELNTELQEFISNNPYQRIAPTFLIWSAGPEGMDAKARAAKRLDLLRRLGVLVMFDSDFSGDEPDATTKPAGYSDFRGRYGDAGGKFQKPGSMRTNPVTIERLSEIGFDIEDMSNDFDLHELRRTIDALRPEADESKTDPFIDPTIRETTVGHRWRSMAGRVTSARSRKKPVLLWDVQKRESIPKPDWLPRLVELAKGAKIVCVIGSQGCGKGHAARMLAHSAPKALGLKKASDCMLVNGGFSFDTDTLLDGVARFLDQTVVHPGELSLDEKAQDANSDPRPRRSRAEFFRALTLAKPRGAKPVKRVLVILNGVERFFDLEGHPLSAELDQLLHALASPVINKKADASMLSQDSNKGARGTKPDGVLPSNAEAERATAVGVFIFGTERVRGYMEKIGACVVNFNDLVPECEQSNEAAGFPGWYLASLWDQAVRRGVKMPPALAAAKDRYVALSSGRVSGDSIDLRHSLFGAIFDDHTLSVLLAPVGASPRRDLVRPARKLLRALAFIGLPSEREVLMLMPGLNAEPLADVAMDALIEASLVLELAGYRSAGEAGKTSAARFALHRSLLTELRHRYGIPLSEAKLSTAFNMSLFIAQPSDGDIPDTDIHDQLGSAIDQLIGSYRLPDHVADKKTRRKTQSLNVSEQDYSEALKATAKACGSSDKAAPGGLESQKALADTQRLCSRRHVQALRTALALVRSYYSTTGLLTLDSGDRLIAPGRDGVLREHAERLDELIDGYGKVTLARQFLRSKMTELLKDAGAGFVDVFGDAEPFYADELVWLHNERGVVRLAMGDLYEARRSFIQAMKVNRLWVERGDRGHNWRRVRLNNLIVDIERGQIGLAQRKCEELLRVPKEKGLHLREDDLAEAIVIGCQAWCMQLTGRNDIAIALYEEACNKLSELHEVRAQAFFERLRADAMGSARASPAERRVVIERALNLALSTKQMDLVHRLRVTLADTILFGEEIASEERKLKAHRYLEDALAYSLHAEVHRVRCEASMSTARARLQMSDYEGALRFASDAMMIATRYGMQLRKISIRALIAKVMAARGHPVTADHLARTCIKMASRRNFQTAIDKASKVLIEIPRISSAISVSDNSGRRNF